MIHKDRHGTTIVEPPKEIADKPWAPAPFELPEAYAVQALAQGKASAHQQQMAMKWVIEKLCGTYDLSARFGQDGARETDFAEGKRYVGLQLVKLTKLNLSIYEEKP